MTAGVATAISAAVCLGAIAVAWVALAPRRPTLARWVTRHRLPGSAEAGRPSAPDGGALGGVRGALSAWRRRWNPADRVARSVLRAGLPISPRLAVTLTLLATAGAAAALVAVEQLGWVAIPLPIAVAVVAGVPVLAASEVAQRGRRRRATVLGQLPILTDLMVLEQTGGGVGFRRALEEVVGQVGGPASDCLQACLAHSALTGGPHLDDRIDALGQELGVPALASLATVARLQRTEGAAVGPVLRQLAGTLRDQQRDALLTAGKRKVVQMLLPTGLCILLPFIALVLYPALARLFTVLS